jgi:hypothetical protein
MIMQEWQRAIDEEKVESMGGAFRSKSAGALKLPPRVGTRSARGCLTSTKVARMGNWSPPTHLGSYLVRPSTCVRVLVVSDGLVPVVTTTAVAAAAVARAVALALLEVTPSLPTSRPRTLHPYSHSLSFSFFLIHAREEC